MPESEEIKKLYSGIVIAIDEAIGATEDRINKILEQVESRSFPVCKYTSLPKSEDFFENLQSIGFIILDWDLNSSPALDEGVQLPAHVKEEAFKDNLIFLKQIKENCFAPIFILTNTPDSAKKWLEDNGDGIYDPVKTDRNFIFIGSKKSVTEEGNLFEVIENWIKSNPSIYTLKKWERNFYKAKNSTFSGLYNSSPIWPKVLWKAFNDDSVHEGLSIDEIIYLNIKGRGALLELDSKIISNYPDGDASAEEIKSLVVNSQFVFAKNLPENDLQPGDVFSGEKKDVFYINIRPICDTVIGRDTCDGIAYCLRGKKISNKEVSTNYKAKYGYIVQRDNEYIIFGIEGEKFISFSLNTLHQFEFKNIKGKRIQRLLPPHITNLQQKYSGYIGRVGLPRTFKEIIPILPVSEENNDND